MGEPIRCFLVMPTGRMVRGLRRYSVTSEVKCSTGYGYHNANVAIDQVLASDRLASGDSWPHDDPRWPVKCEHCDYTFSDQDAWQLFMEREYKRKDTGGLGTLATFPAGCMWWADWLGGHFDSPKHQARGGGSHLLLKTPGGDWDIDAKASNGDGWERTGSPPDVVAWPSIGIYGHDGSQWKYHGFLGGSAGDKPGYLVEC